KRSPNVTCPGRGATRSGAKWCAAEPGPLRTPRPGKSHRSGPPSDSKRHPPNAHCRFGRVPLFKPQFRVIAPVAQLDRALPSEGKGQRFESSRARQLLLGKVVVVQAVSSEALLHRAASKQPEAKEAVPKPKALFRMPFALAGVARSLAKIGLGLALLSAPAVGASETVPIKRLSPDAARPSIVRDAIEAADWMAKSLVDQGYKADFSLESLKEV